MSRIYTKLKNKILWEIQRIRRIPYNFSWEGRFLLKNVSLRMDASKPIFNKARRKFHLARYTFAAKYVEGKIVGDIACGTGYGSQILGRLGAKKVIGIDINPESTFYAQKVHSKPNINYLTFPGDNIPLSDDFFDVIVSFETIEHVENDIGLLKEFQRLLKSDGILILSSPNDWGLTEHHVHSYKYQDITHLFSQFFDIIAIYNQNSGCMDREVNHRQPFGIIETRDENYHLAECFILIGRRSL